jgi:predicted DNA-binding transcriptional regulator AlpA
MHPQTHTQTVMEPEAARYIALSCAYLRHARAHGRGPAYIRIGRAVRYRIADLDAYLAAHRVETRAAGR